MTRVYTHRVARLPAPYVTPSPPATHYAGSAGSGPDRSEEGFRSPYVAACGRRSPPTPRPRSPIATRPRPLIRGPLLPRLLFFADGLARARHPLYTSCTPSGRPASGASANAVATLRGKSAPGRPPMPSPPLFRGGRERNFSSAPTSGVPQWYGSVGFSCYGGL